MPFLDTSLKLGDVPPGQSRCLEFGDLQVGLFRNADGFFAINNTCPHRGAPLHQGVVSDGQVTCPWHQWQFRLGDGVCRNIPNIKISTYAVEIRDGAIWVDIRDSQEKNDMKSAYEIAMERLEKKAPTIKLTPEQKARIAEINSLYGSKIAEKETFLQGEIAKEKIKGDAAAIAQIQDQLGREVRRLHVEWEEKKAAVHGEKTNDEATVGQIAGDDKKSR